MLRSRSRGVGRRATRPESTKVYGGALQVTLLREELGGRSRALGCRPSTVGGVAAWSVISFLPTLRGFLARELRRPTQEVCWTRGSQRDRVKCPDLSLAVGALRRQSSSLCEVLRRDHIGTGSAKRQTGCQVSAGGQQPLAPALRVIRHTQPVVVAPRLLNQGETQARDLKVPLRHSPPLAGPPSVDSAARLGALPGTGAHGSALRISRRLSDSFRSSTQWDTWTWTDLTISWC